MNKNFLQIQDVTFAASQKNKVNNVTFNLEKEGEIICLLGPSGIGKTTIQLFLFKKTACFLIIMLLITLSLEQTETKIKSLIFLFMI